MYHVRFPTVMCDSRMALDVFIKGNSRQSCVIADKANRADIKCNARTLCVIAEQV